MTHEQLVKDGYTYFARRGGEYGSDERRLYSKSDGYMLVVMRGTTMHSCTSYTIAEYKKAYDHLQNGRT